MTIGQRISKIRKDNNLSQEGFGDVLGVSRQAISKWESDSSIPDVEKLILISKTYNVSVGWILGIEEQPKSESGELSQNQLYMAQEIAKQYIDALPKPDRKKPRKMLMIIAAAAALALFIWCLDLSNRLSNMQSQYFSLQSNITNVQTSLDNQSYNLSNRIEEILKSQNSLLADSTYNITEYDLANNTVDISISVVPKTYMENMTALFTVSADDGHEIQTNTYPGVLSDDRTFSVQARVPMTDLITMSVTLSSDDVEQTQIIDIIYGEYTNSWSGLDNWCNTFSSTVFCGMSLDEMRSGGISFFAFSPEQTSFGFNGLSVELEKLEFAIFIDNSLWKNYNIPLDGNSDGFAGTITPTQYDISTGKAVPVNSQFEISLSLPGMPVQEGSTIDMVMRQTDNFGRVRSILIEGYKVRDGVCEFRDNVNYHSEYDY